MTDDEAQAEILGMASENGKMAIELGLIPKPPLQLALERLQLRGWLRLIDVTPISAVPDRMFRIFLASDEAQAWLAGYQGRTQ